MKFIADGVIRLHYVPTIANTAAPTMAEIGAGVELTGFLRSLDTPLEGSTVDAATAESRYNKTVGGTYGGQPITGEFTRSNDYDDDDAWLALARETTGYFVVARRGGSGTDGAIAATDRVDVWSVEIISRNPSAYNRNTLETFTVTASVNEEPDEDVAVAAA